MMRIQNPDLSFQIRAQNLEKVLKEAHIFHTLWLVIAKYLDPYPNFHFEADPDPAYHADPCGSGSTTLLNMINPGQNICLRSLSSAL
jgi:hypothetical protein